MDLGRRRLRCEAPHNRRVCPSRPALPGRARTGRLALERRRRPTWSGITPQRRQSTRLKPWLRRAGRTLRTAEPVAGRIESGATSLCRMSARRNPNSAVPGSAVGSSSARQLARQKGLDPDTLGPHCRLPHRGDTRKVRDLRNGLVSSGLFKPGELDGLDLREFVD